MNILLVFLSLFTCNAMHPVHLSVTNVEYFNKGKYFEISVRLFLNDLEKNLDANNNIILNIGKNNEDKNANIYITNYVANNLIFTLNGEKIPLNKYNLTKKKIEDLTIWLTFKIRYKPIFNNVKITNTLMFDLYPDQKNMLIFTINNNQMAFDFNKNKTKTEFSIKN